VDAMTQALKRLCFKKHYPKKPEPDGFYVGTELEDLGYKKYEIRRAR